MAKGFPAFCLVVSTVLSSAEQLFDIVELQFHIGRPAVVALAGARRAFHLAQQGIHLVAVEPAPRPHRMVAGERREDMIEAALQARHIRLVLGESGGEIAQQLAGVEPGEKRGRLAQEDRAWPEAFDREAEAQEERRRLDEPLDVDERPRRRARLL